MLTSTIGKKSLLLAFNFQHACFSQGLKTMQAWQILGYGGQEQFQLNKTAYLPIISNPTDVLINVHASSINPLDVQMLAGYGATTFRLMRKLKKCSPNPQEFPLVLGRDFSGTVVHVGKNVKNFTAGDEVWGVVSPWENGSHADYIKASECSLSPKPSSLNHVEASSIPYVALTAWPALCTYGGLSERSTYGKRILVIGASGGVGTFAVQLLKAWGADVTAICAGDAVEMVMNLGADSVLDYQSPDFKQSLKALKGFDLIFDNIGREYPELTINLLKKWKNAKYITVVSPLLKNVDDRGIVLGSILSGIQASLDTAMSLKDGRSFRWAYFMPNGCALKKIAKMVDDKQINPVIDTIYKFQDLPEAYTKALNGHARGKIVINHKMPKDEESRSNEKHN